MLGLLLAISDDYTKTKFEKLYYHYRDLLMFISLKVLNKTELAEEQCKMH